MKVQLKSLMRIEYYVRLHDGNCLFLFFIIYQSNSPHSSKMIDINVLNKD